MKKKKLLIIMLLINILIIIGLNHKLYKSDIEKKELEKIAVLTNNSYRELIVTNDWNHKAVKGMILNVKAPLMYYPEFEDKRPKKICARIHVSAGGNLYLGKNTSGTPYQMNFYQECFSDYISEEKYIMFDVYVDENAKIGYTNVIDTDEQPDCLPAVYNPYPITVVNNPSIQITTTASRPSILAGNDVTFTINIKNTGEFIMRDTILKDRLNNNFTFLSASKDYTITNGEYIFNIPDIEPDDSYNLTIKAKANNEVSSGSIIENTATVSATYAETKSDTKNITIEAPTPIVTPAFTLTSTTSKAQVEVGEIFDYIITAKNTSTVNASNVTITSTIASDFEIIEANGAINNNGILTWNTNINAIEEKRFIVKLKPKSNISNGTILTNTTNLLYDGSEKKEVNNSITITKTETIETPTFTLSSTPSKTKVKQGEVFNYIIRAKNTSTVNASNVTISSTIASNLDIIDANGATNNNGILTWETSIKANEIKNYIIKVKMKEDTEIGTMVYNKTNLFYNGIENNEIKSMVEVQITQINILVTSDKKTAESKEQITYTIKVQNNNDVVAKNIKVTQKFDSNLIIESAKNGEINNNIVTYTIDSLAANSEVVFIVKTRVKEEVKENEILDNKTEVNENGMENNFTSEEQVVLTPSDLNDIENPQTGVPTIITLVIWSSILFILIIKKVKKSNNFYKI